MISSSSIQGTLMASKCKSGVATILGCKNRLLALPQLPNPVSTL
jgi:hypothetical protein